ncbi:DUF4174 domain-containing protein [Vibrio tubiashii]|uniref:DUF4174 domain-containing protein n=1 Tax=Vibrio tubiashii TaxID=29498 RepID=A0AAE5LIU1_9VIBR|nr:DUF4174 domain-containing protein [Vibrio tubiashii]NOI81983.1 DUF4174 domain-containing protein [Vibrio tubiashii]WCP68833.1 DUF4174 domain-containing protein [Vibrio tubiashii]
MRAALLFTIALLNSTMSWAYPSYSAEWSHRSVIYFAPTNDEHVKQFLLETLINECELQDRDLITLVVTEDGFSMPKWVKHEFNLKALFNMYDVKPGSHTAVLIGKDGGEKLRWGKQTDWEHVKQTIDVMPMRRYEMAQKVSPCSA